MSEEKKLTTASGIPYYYNEDTLSAGPRGPLVLGSSFVYGLRKTDMTYHISTYLKPFFYSEQLE
jgi:hypothetical protein